jgi:UPF0716 protein FxsA
MYLLLAFLLVPIIEIGLFIQVGGAIGLWPTLGIVVLTAVIGAKLVQNQGRAAMLQMRTSFSELSDPTEPLAHGAMILVAGALLLTPGFFTDTIGFLLLIPPVRLAVLRFLRARVTLRQFQMGPQPGSRGFTRGDVIDGEFEEVGRKPRPETGKSDRVEKPERH